jgi:lysophospholipase L1-like esterase
MTGIWAAASPYTTDNVHPNDAGHALIAGLLKTQLAQML